MCYQHSHAKGNLKKVLFRPSDNDPREIIDVGKNKNNKMLNLSKSPCTLIYNTNTTK